MSGRRRKCAFAACAALTLCLHLAGCGTSKPTAQETSSSQASSHADASPHGSEHAIEHETPASVDLFPAQSWLPPPPPPPPPSEPQHLPPPPPAEPPPLPFIVKAVWREQGRVLYVELSASGQSFLICGRCRLEGFSRVGSTLLGQYRVAAMRGNTIGFTYLPLNRSQSLPLESAQ